MLTVYQMLSPVVIPLSATEMTLPRSNCFLAGAFLSFIVIGVNNGKANPTIQVWCFFEVHSKHSVSYDIYCTTKQYKTLAKDDKFPKIKKPKSKETKGFQAISEHMLLQNCGGLIAAPVVKGIFENILPYLGIEKTITGTETEK